MPVGCAMDVIFEPLKERPFAIEVGFFDTVLEIKEKIQKYHRIPISKQTLIFNGHVLQDDRDVEFCEILHNSRIQIHVASEPTADRSSSAVKLEAPSPSNKIHLNVTVPAIQTHFPIDMDPGDSIGRLKERIHEMDAAVPVNRLVLQSNGGGELLDHWSLRECELGDNSDVEVCLRPSPTASAATSGTTTTVASTGLSKKLKVMVKPKCGTQKIAMEVNASDNVGELKKELQKLQQRLHFHLPQEGFFFIYDRDVMDEERSFRWHGVSQGDTIEIFNGSVTGGS